MYNKMNKFKEGCNYMNLKKAKLFICTLLFTMAFVSVSSVSASKTPPTDTSTEENAPETESSEEIFHLPAILFFHCTKSLARRLVLSTWFYYFFQRNQFSSK